MTKTKGNQMFNAMRDSHKQFINKGLKMCKCGYCGAKCYPTPDHPGFCSLRCQALQAKGE